MATTDVEKTKSALNVLNNTDALSKLGIAKCEVCTGDCPVCPVAEIAKKAALDPDFAKKLSTPSAAKSFKLGLTGFKLGVKPEQYKEMAQKAKAANPGKELTAEQIFHSPNEAAPKEKFEKAGKVEQSPKAEVRTKEETPEEVKASNKPVVRATEISVDRKKDEDFKVKPSVMQEQIQRTASAQFNNAADLQRFHMMQRQSGIAPGNQADFYLAARAKAAANQAEMFKKQEVTVSQGNALLQNHAKLQALMNQTIQQATHIRNILANQKQEERIIVNHKQRTTDILPKVNEQMKKIERAVETIIKHSWQQLNKREQKMFTEVRNGMKIVNSIPSETRKSALHKQVVVQNLKSVERAMKILRSKGTTRAMRMEVRRNIKLRTSQPGKAETRIRDQRNIKRDVKSDSKLNTGIVRGIKARSTNARSISRKTGLITQRPEKQFSRQNASEIRIDRNLKANRNIELRNERGAESKIITDRMLVRELGGMGLRGKELKTALRAEKAEFNASPNTHIKKMKNERTDKRSKENLETRVVRNRNIQRSVKVATAEPKLSHKLNLKNTKNQGLVPAFKARKEILVEQIKKVAGKSLVLSKIVKDVKKLNVVVVQTVSFIKSVFVRKERPLNSLKKILASKKSISRKEFKKLKAKMDAKELFELQMWLESVKKKKKFRVKGYENGAPRVLESKEQKDFMEADIPIDTAPEVGQQQEQAVF